MSHLKTRQLIGADNPSKEGVRAHVAEVVHDHFSDPLKTENVRRALRSWFMAYLPNWESRFGPFDLEGSLQVYESLDELLSGFIQDAKTDQ